MPVGGVEPDFDLTPAQCAALATNPELAPSCQAASTLCEEFCAPISDGGLRFAPYSVCAQGQRITADCRRDCESQALPYFSCLGEHQLAAADHPTNGCWLFQQCVDLRPR